MPKRKQKSTRGAVIATTDGQLEQTQPGIFNYCRERLRRQVKTARMELIEVANPPGAERSVKQMIRNVLWALDQTTARTVWIAEHDVIYPDGYFEAKVGHGPASKLTYANPGEVCYLTRQGFRKRGLPNAPFSTLAGRASMIRQALQDKLLMDKIRWVEPGVDDGYVDLVTFREANGTVIDIRHGGNASGHREGKGPAEVAGMDAAQLWGEIDAMANPPVPELVAPVLPQTSSPVKYVQPGFITSVSYIITAREEPLLRWTIDNLRRTIPAKNSEIIVVYDGWQAMPDLPGVNTFCPWPVPLGVGPSRDYGLERASSEVAIVMDSHMDYAPGWVEGLLATLGKHPDAIVCPRCAILRPNRLKMAEAEGVHKGAVMQWINEKGMPFEPKWNENANPGEIQLPLGACYSFRRERYMTDLCRVWQRGFGWGSSEHVISVANWFIGGTSELADCTVGHVFRDKEKSLPYRVTPMNEAGVFYNRCRLIDLLPISDDEKRTLCNRVLNRRDASRHRGFVAQLFKLREGMDAELKAKICAGRSYGEWIAKWYPPEKQKQPQQPAPAPTRSRPAAMIPPPRRGVTERFVGGAAPDSRFI